MLTSGSTQKPYSAFLRFFAFAVAFLLCASSSLSNAQTNTTTPTVINISEGASLTNAKRLGIVLSTQTFYDAGQFMRNLAYTNPGFEAEQWQSILHCVAVTATSCTDDNTYTYWPVNFLQGATAEFIVGAAKGETATVTSSTLPVPGTSAVTISFAALATAPAVGDYVVVRMSVPGSASAGWWTQTYGGATLGTDTTDLSPNTIGKQALIVNASAAGQEATVSSYMDGTPGRSFIQLHGTYTLTFRAKGIGGANQVAVSIGRAVDAPPAVTFFNQTVSLTNSWQDYTYTFQANDTGRLGAIALTFTVAGTSMYLDDVALTEAAAPNNPTVYRNAVVTTLQNLHPGVLRYMDSGENWGSSIENIIAPDFARLRPGYSNHNSVSAQIPLSLHDFLVLCQTIGAEPWYTMQTGMSTQEMSNLMDYLGGSTSTVYGAKRAALGQTAPWTTVFPTIHLEFGNEVWNTSNPGANITDPTSYGLRAADIFAAAKASPSYSAKSFDLIQDGFEAVPAWTQAALASSSNYDSVDVAAYIFGPFDDASSIENIFGPMFATPEALDSVPGGIMQQQAAVAAAATPPAKLAIYEENMGTVSGSASQSDVESAIASLGAGLTTADNMLLMMRDLGINNQNMFALPGYSAPFTGTNGSNATTSPIWGEVIDMGGPTNLLRPTYLSEQLANSAILPTMLLTSQTGANPTWNQPFTTNGNFSLNGAHYIQSFAYTDGTTLNVILLNLSRTSALPVTFAGLNTPVGSAKVTTLTASAITVNNETQANIAPTSTTTTLAAGSTLSLPPYSMTVVSAAAPFIPAGIDSLTVSCANSKLSPNATTTCTDQLDGQGKYNPAVTWSVDQGSISSTGGYTAPSSLPADGKAVVTVTSVQDTTKTASFTILVQPDTITGVTMTCPVSSLFQGATTKCSGTVAGTGSFSPAFTWSASAGTIDSKGNFTAPTTGKSVVITATSTQDPAKSSSATLTLSPQLLISNPTFTVTATTATITWSVNQPARNGVSWGLTPQYLGGATPYDNNVLTQPSYTIAGLTPNTTYYMLPTSYNSSGATFSPIVITTSNQTGTVTGLSVNCGTTSLVFSATAGCSAKVTGTGTYSNAVTWTTTAGSINGSGSLTAPTFGISLTVTATSVQDTTKSASQVITLSSPATISSITVACQTTTLVAGSATLCNAPVQGTGNYSTSVTWSASGGTISPTGTFTAPTSGTAVTVTATSVQNPSKSATATISLIPKLAMGPDTFTVTSTSATFSWTVNVPTRNGISWGLTQQYLGGATPYDNNLTLTPSYTITGLAPNTTYYMLLTSYNAQGAVFNPVSIKTLSATAISSVSATCPVSSLSPGGTTTCAAAVKGTGSFSSGVTWSASAGTVDAKGNFTAPATATVSSVTITATSTQDTTKSSSTTIALTPALAILGPATVTVGSNSATFSWALNTPARSGVSWGLTAEYRSGSTPYDNNMLTAPSYTITGLTPNTFYYVLLCSYNSQGPVFQYLTIKTAP